MKKFLLSVLLLLITENLNAQNNYLDSLKQRLYSVNSNTARLELYHEISFSYLWTNTDSAFYYATKVENLSKKLNNVRFKILGKSDKGTVLNVVGNYDASIQIILDALQLAENSDMKGLIARCYNSLGGNYSELENYEEAIFYFQKARSICIQINDKERLAGILANLADAYFNLNQLDSSMYYVQEAYKLINSIDNWKIDMLGNNYITQGKIQLKLKNYDIAVAYLKKALDLSLHYRDWVDYFEASNTLADLYSSQGQNDSSKHYYYMALQSAKKGNYIKGLLSIYNSLSRFYYGGNKDSTIKYLYLENSLKDSVLSLGKIKRVQILSFNERERQKEIENAKLEAAFARKLNLQYSLIALGIIIFIALFFLFSRSIIVNEKWISFFGVLGLLVLFEFINLLVHPLLASITHESPIIMLIILVVIASMLIPMHHRLEKLIKGKVVEKNKRIRLEAAKKTIEKLTSP